jgi:hypothetical protein
MTGPRHAPGPGQMERRAGHGPQSEEPFAWAFGHFAKWRLVVKARLVRFSHGARTPAAGRPPRPACSVPSPGAEAHQGRSSPIPDADATRTSSLPVRPFLQMAPASRPRHAAPRPGPRLGIPVGAGLPARRARPDCAGAVAGTPGPSCDRPWRFGYFAKQRWGSQGPHRAFSVAARRLPAASRPRKSVDDAGRGTGGASADCSVSRFWARDGSFGPGPPDPGDRPPDSPRMPPGCHHCPRIPLCTLCLRVDVRRCLSMPLPKDLWRMRRRALYWPFGQFAK